MEKISSRQRRFYPDIIRQAVWLYFRFTINYRDAEDLLAERGRASLKSANDPLRTLGGATANNQRTPFLIIWCLDTTYSSDILRMSCMGSVLV